MMNRLIAICFAIFVLTGLKGYSQAVPNGGFENWTLIEYFEEPDIFASSNSLTFMMDNVTNVIKTTDHHSGTYAARLETMSFGSDTIPGLMVIGKLAGDVITGGVPYNARPDSLSGYIKYNMLGGDELYIACLFTRSGLPIGTLEATFTGSQANYTRFSVAIDWLVPFINPDSLKVAIVTSSDMTSGHPGSYAFIDGLQFQGTNVPFPNGDLENWVMLSGEEPDDWTTINYLTLTTDAPYATKTNDSHQGSWAIRLTNINSFVGLVIGFLTNGEFQGFDWGSGMAVDQNPSSISGYYKYSPVGADSAQVGVTSYYYDVTGDSIIILETQALVMSAANTYTYFEIPLDYNGTPTADTVNITFSAGYYVGNPPIMNEGSILYLDDIQISYFPVGLDDAITRHCDVLLFPNPSSGILYLQNNSCDQDALSFRLYDAKGIIVYESETGHLQPSEKFRIDIEDLADGLYMYFLSGNQSNNSGKLLIRKN